MSAFLYLAGFVMAAVGGLVLVLAGSALHEILASILIIGGFVLWGIAALIAQAKKLVIGGGISPRENSSSSVRYEKPE